MDEGLLCHEIGPLATLSSQPSNQNQMPKLGDFGKLSSYTGLEVPDPTSTGLKALRYTHLSLQGGKAARSHPSVPKLGDISQILSRLDYFATVNREQLANDGPTGSNSKKSPLEQAERFTQQPSHADESSDPLTGSEPRISTRVLERLFDADYSAGSDFDIHHDTDHALESDAGTPCTTPPPSTESQALPVIVDSGKEDCDVYDASGLVDQCRKYLPKVQQILSYQLYKYGPTTPIYDEPRTRKEKYESLSQRLLPLRAQDSLSKADYPEIGHNGIHVFLDMSNINISFQETLRTRHSVDEEARFVPLPSLDLTFLREILVRGRRIVTLNAGCSVPPGKSEPRYVQELRDHGFHVDLRERKRIVAPPNKPSRRKAAAAISSSDEQVGVVRYVEDLVDETLHTRIAESVMEYFERPGTIVLATGDAQPAKYSDGFFSYAKRALKMGWHVEIVSWKKSMSSFWRRCDLEAHWGTRFRIIELDQFVDELLVTTA